MMMMMKMMMIMMKINRMTKKMMGMVVAMEFR